MAGLAVPIAKSPRIAGIPCWLLPVFSGFAWLITLLSLLITWVAKGMPHFPEMQSYQHLAYISDTGATEWGQPLFIVGAAITTTTFGAAFAAERWLRHEGMLLHNSSIWSTTLTAFSTLFTIAGAVGLMVLTIYDVRDYMYIHYPCVGVFILGYLLAACFMAWEKYLISKAHPTNTLLRWSFRIKFFFILLELLLATVFGVAMLKAGSLKDPSVVVEWVVGFGFSLYMWSFAADFCTGTSSQSQTSETNGFEQDLEKLWEEDVGSLRRPSSARTRSGWEAGQFVIRPSTPNYGDLNRQSTRTGKETQ